MYYVVKLGLSPEYYNVFLRKKSQKGCEKRACGELGFGQAMKFAKVVHIHRS